jgi:peptidoglycan DL-endopeptidase CwlO
MRPLPSRSPRPAATLVAAALSVALTASGLAAVLAPTGAAAAPSSRELRTELDAAQARLDELEGIVGIVVDDYNQVAEAIEQLDARIATTTARLEDNRAAIEGLRASATAHVRRIHKLGPSLELAFLTPDDPLAAPERVVLLRRLVDGQRADIERYAVVVDELARDEALLASQRRDAARQEAELEARRAEVEAVMADHAAEVSDLEARLAAAIDAEERARREAERRRIAQTAAQRAATTVSRSTTTTTTTTSPSPTPVAAVPSAAGAIAVQAALSKIGAPYVWGATGPDSFDCSGLVVWAYRQAGVSLPRTSRDQFAALRPITREELRPGDLVFAGSPTVHHVGIYIGDGMIVHAPYTGSTVSVRSMERADLRGFARVG